MRGEEEGLVMVNLLLLQVRKPEELEEMMVTVMKVLTPRESVSEGLQSLDKLQQRSKKKKKGDGDGVTSCSRGKGWHGEKRKGWCTLHLAQPKQKKQKMQGCDQQSMGLTWTFEIFMDCS
ncbi:hypothetical protein CRG98_034327 [Punica granatum]|uniref:Uncharacterized protein n=1 Tax=Punica granatum TaxID=22663 RepID=A0A2I0IMP8_PUNGR|nr:hypothetical protein CRG98_034327 [Punica granatum]